MLKGLPTVKFIDDGPNAPPGGMNAKPWTLWLNSLSSLLRSLDTTAYGFSFPANVQIEGLPSRNYANDAAAATGGVPIGGLYHNAGAVRVRLT